MRWKKENHLTISGNQGSRTIIMMVCGKMITCFEILHLQLHHHLNHSVAGPHLACDRAHVAGAPVLARRVHVQAKLLVGSNPLLHGIHIVHIH